MPEFFAPIPQDPIAIQTKQDKRLRRNDRMSVNQPWVDWFAGLTTRVDESPRRVDSAISIAAQSANASGNVLTVTVSGLYRVSYSTRVTTAAGTSSSLQVTIGWTESGIALTDAGSSLTGNTTTTQEGRVVVVLADAASPITYSTSYTSSGSPAMQYRLTAVAELIEAS